MCVCYVGIYVKFKDHRSIKTAMHYPVTECHAAGLVNYCVPAGQAQLKALEIAQEINQKVQICLQNSLVGKTVWCVI